MTILYSIVVSSLVVGVLNLIAVLFLSNAMFRILLASRAPPEKKTSKSPEKGLVDVKQTMTYDPRFSAKTDD
jgi:hypothetical protein